MTGESQSACCRRPPVGGLRPKDSPPHHVQGSVPSIPCPTEQLGQGLFQCSSHHKPGIILSTLYILSYTVLLRAHEATTLIIFLYKPRLRVSDLPKIKISRPVNKEPEHGFRSGQKPRSLYSHLSVPLTLFVICAYFMLTAFWR